jgi:flagellar motor switch protein FliM
LQRTEIRLDGVLAEMEIPLATALGWKAGTFIELNKSADGSADLLSGDMRLLSGHIGQSKGQIAIKIEKNIFDASEEQNA